MTNTIPQLDELQADLLTELFNIGVGRAAASLSEMMKQEIKISCPSIVFCTVPDLIKNFSDKEKIISISQNISAPFNMQSILIFPSTGSTEVIRAMIGEDLSDEIATEMQQEAFTEIGNIVLNACIGTIAKALEENFIIELPHFFKDSAENIFVQQIDNNENLILSMQVDLILSSSSIKGYFAFILGSISMDVLKRRLDIMLGELI